MTPKVYLVGAGPGDPELITVKGKRVLQQAQVVIYDRLVGEGVLAFANPSAELIFAGKEASFHSSTQDEINRLLASQAKKGKRVVRLKGGDPYTFGRGGEEACHLAVEGIPFEVVPGITAAAGVASYAGIPLTDRRYSQAVTLVTGHRMGGEGIESLNWASLARLGHTLVFYMGVANISEITGRLILNGREPSTPAALVSNATTAFQRTIMGSLCDIALKCAQKGVRPPALLVIGEAVSLSPVLNWFEPSCGKDESVPGAATYAKAKF